MKGILVFVVGITLIVMGCSDRKDGSDQPSSDGRLRIVATTGMIADAARNIVGEHAEVVGLMGAGVDPHLYKATQNDLKLLSEADIILYNGLHLEGKMADVLGKLAARKLVIALAEGLDTTLLRRPPEFEGAYDPHVWFDVDLWKRVAQNLTDTLTALDAENVEVYRSNGGIYTASLDALDEWVIQQISTTPEKSRVLVTAHDAFGYFGGAYGIEVRGLQGISTVSEAGLADRAAMIDLIVERKVKAVFIESSINPKAIEAIVEGVNGRGHSVSIGGELFSDAMGEDGTPEGTYVGMVRANVNTIVEALR
ncbi:MAG: zinc ABC transporter substrate-binding protein [Chlorobi bacterium]|nr:zinc ABC transporter substrate-binding protein [Chlorobiota bacterium]